MKKILAQVAWVEARKNSSIACPWFLYTRKLPEKVRKLRKF